MAATPTLNGMIVVLGGARSGKSAFAESLFSECAQATLNLTGPLSAATTPVLVDCLTIWLSNLMHHEKDIDAEIDSLLGVLSAMTQPVVLVSNEVGGGIVPENKLAREFRDLAGLMNQKFAAAADQVFLITVGLPQQLK